MQRGLRVVAEMRPDAVGDQRIEPRALVHLVEVRQRLVLVEHAAFRVAHRRPVHVVEQALGEVGGWRQILQPLLILNADGVAAELIGDAHRGDVHLALLQDLSVRQFGFGIEAGEKLHAARIQPCAYASRLILRNALHGGVEC